MSDTQNKIDTYQKAIAQAQLCLTQSLEMLNFSALAEIEEKIKHEQDLNIKAEALKVQAAMLGLIFMNAGRILHRGCSLLMTGLETSVEATEQKPSTSL